MQLVGNHACAKAARYPKGACYAVIKGIQIIKKKHAEVLGMRELMMSDGVTRSIGCPTDALPTHGSL